MAPKKYADQTRSGRHQASVSFVHPRVERFNFRELARFTPARSSPWETRATRQSRRSGGGYRGWPGIRRRAGGCRGVDLFVASQLSPHPFDRLHKFAELMAGSRNGENGNTHKYGTRNAVFTVPPQCTYERMSPRSALAERVSVPPA